MRMVEEYDAAVPAADATLAVGTAVERAAAVDADRAAATRAARRAIAQFDVDAAISLYLLHRTAAPALAVTGAERQVLPYALSIAHRDGHAVAAAARAGVLIGVDVERAGSIDAADMRLFATAAERESGVDATRLWILKEAAWKALACPPTLPFHALELDIRRGAVTGVRLNGERARAHAHLWTPWPGWLAALVVAGGRAA